MIRIFIEKSLTYLIFGIYWIAITIALFSYYILRIKPQTVALNGLIIMGYWRKNSEVFPFVFPLTRKIVINNYGTVSFLKATEKGYNLEYVETEI